ncbi:MAG TPA: hypothetical protein VIF64_17480 [Pyrinomonadaceae bacterium]|jgi:hypothetical protein
MYCPSCGVKEDQVTQFCRTCGIDLRVVRVSLEMPEPSASTVTARDEVARAVAAKVQEGKWWQLAAMVPEVERLFESPQMRELRLSREAEAQRLRRLRAGVITSAVGLGTILLLLIVSLAKPDLLLLAGPSLVVLLVGLGILINGLLFTVPKGSAVDISIEKEKLDTPSEFATTAEIRADLPSVRPSFSPYTVTDQTTRHLSSELVKPPTRGTS